MTNLEKIRRKKGITQTELSKLTNLSQPYIHDLERGNRGAKPETLLKLARALDCTIDDLKNADDGESA